MQYILQLIEEKIALASGQANIRTSDEQLGDHQSSLASKGGA